jgi:alpha-tubulin suppressor-like RCC1 family protein
MSARTTVGRGLVRRLVVPTVLVSLAAGLGSLVSVAQPALATLPGVAAISAGGEHACGIVNGDAYCWGENFSGELGDGANTNSAVPVAVDTSGVLAGQTLALVSSGYSHTCALNAAGQAYCWGLNSNGQLGDGNTTNSSVPVAVDTSGVLAGKTLTQITSGIVDTCALDSAGAAYCWGANSYGQLGDGGTTNSSVPVAVRTTTTLAGRSLTQITVGYESTCVLDSAGTAYCWGLNSYGQLGDGNTTSSSVPVAVDSTGLPTGQALAQLSAGWYHTCAVDSAGAAYCWGRNSAGQLGDASSFSSSVPVAVDTAGALAGQIITQVTSGANDTCALDAAGDSYCWGANSYGQLGDGSTTNSAVPVAVNTGGALAGKALTQISAGIWHTCGLDAAGAPYCWGGNASGQLGDDSYSPSAVPVPVGL